MGTANVEVVGKVYRELELSAVSNRLCLACSLQLLLFHRSQDTRFCRKSLHLLHVQAPLKPAMQALSARIPLEDQAKIIGRDATRAC